MLAEAAMAVALVLVAEAAMAAVVLAHHYQRRI